MKDLSQYSNKTAARKIEIVRKAKPVENSKPVENFFKTEKGYGVIAGTVGAIVFGALFSANMNAPKQAAQDLAATQDARLIQVYDVCVATTNDGASCANAVLPKMQTEAARQAFKMYRADR
jgi:hypothetical protein